MNFNVGEHRLTVPVLTGILKGTTSITISEIAHRRVHDSALVVAQTVANGKPVYGINTGFGPLCDTRISADQSTRLQHNLLQSHAVGVGEPISPDLSLSMLVCKVHALAMGYSGVAFETIERMLWHIRERIIPVVPARGSVGASGDLAPLAHLFLPLIGCGQVWVDGRRVAAAEVLQRYGLEPLALGPKEGLALVNGTQFILAHAAEMVTRMHDLLELADIAGAVSLEALMGSAAPFDQRLHELRAFRGSLCVAQRIRTMLQGSEILVSHAECDRIQDPYSIRCMPQVHGASRNAWLHLRELVETELNSVTDNPVILSRDAIISGGNFHGQPLALPLDYAAFAAAELGNIADRRCYMIIEGRYNLPKLLIADAGLNSGFMIPQYTSAALVTENKTLCFPASADSVPTSLGQEDHVSMGAWSGRKALLILDNLEYIFAVELLYAAQALDFRRPLRSSPVLEAVHELIRQHVPFATEDRVFGEDLAILHRLIRSREIQSLVDEHLKFNDGYAEFSLS
jgi:histidine ammonia-lyase